MTLMSRGSLVLAWLACACAPEAGDGEPLDAPTACPADELVQLASWPAWPGSRWFIGSIDERLLYSVHDGEQTIAAMLDPCTGEAAPAAVANASDFTVTTTPHGRLLYGTNGAGEVLILDDLDAPGFAAPRRVDGPPEIGDIDAVPGGVLLCTPRSPVGPPAPRACWVHAGDPTEAPLAVGDAISSWLVTADAMFLLDASGVLRSGDARSSDTTQIAADVRRMWLAPEQRHLVWEAGDDAATQIVARDLQTGDQHVLVQDHEPGAGRWIFNGDGTAGGLVDDDHHLGALFRLDSGAALSIPEHVAVTRYSHGREFDLQLASETGNHTRAYWDPFLADAPRIWFDDSLWFGGPAPQRDGDIVVYTLDDVCVPTRTVYRVDLTTGEPTQIAHGVSGSLVPLADGRFLTTVSDDDWDLVGDLVVLDPDNRSLRVLAEDVDEWVHVEGRGVFYVRATGDDAGVWAVPVPARSSG